NSASGPEFSSSCSSPTHGDCRSPRRRHECDEVIVFMTLDLLTPSVFVPRSAHAPKQARVRRAGARVSRAASEAPSVPVQLSTSEVPMVAPQTDSPNIPQRPRIPVFRGASASRRSNTAKAVNDSSAIGPDSTDTVLICIMMDRAAITAPPSTPRPMQTKAVTSSLFALRVRACSALLRSSFLELDVMEQVYVAVLGRGGSSGS